MTAATKPSGKNIKFKAQLLTEYKFLKNIFELSSIPLQKDDNENDADFEMVSGNVKQEDKVLQNRARSIAELELKLEKIKSQNQFHLKDKLAKKSLTSKINKKLKKAERQANKHRVKQPNDTETELKQEIKKEKLEKPLTPAKPVFNTDGKLVFSKFDFAKTDNFDKSVKGEKDPKKILNSIKHQEEKFKKLEESDNKEKVKEIKEKLAWKTTLQKAEGQKIKDDPILLKKSIKKMDQKKKHSKKQWDNRIESVAQKKEERQKKRKENISKKKKEKKSKIVKTAAKRGRVVI